MRVFIQITLLIVCGFRMNFAYSNSNLDSIKLRLTSIKQNQLNQKNRIQELYLILSQLEQNNSDEAQRLSFQTLHELSDQFYNLGLFNYALEHNKRALSLPNELVTKPELSEMYEDRGNIFTHYIDLSFTNENYVDSAYQSYQKALEIIGPYKNNQDISTLYNSLSNYFIKTKDYKEAKKWIKLAEKEANLWANQKMQITSAYHLARIYIDQGDYDIAIKESSFQLSRPEIKDFIKLKMLFHNNLYIAYNELNQSKLALENLEQYLALQDQFEQNERLVNSLDINQLYRAEQLRNENLAYQIEASKNQTKETKSQSVIIILISLLTFFLIVGLTYFVKERYKQQNLRLKLVQKVQQFEIESINSLVDGRELERKDIGRFLHDDVSALVNSANIHLEVMATQTNLEDNPILLKTQQILDEIADKVRSLSHQLLNDVLQKYGLEVALKELTARLETTMINFKFESELPPEQRYNEIIENKIYGVVQELINNILKHSEARNATVQLSQTKSNLIIQVIDDGKGFSKEDALRGGVGLNQIRTRVRSMNGSLKINSDQGTQIKFKIPIDLALNKPAQASLVT